MFRNTDFGALSLTVARKDLYRATAWFAVYFIQIRMGAWGGGERFPYVTEDYAVRAYIFQLKHHTGSHRTIVVIQDIYINNNKK